MTGPVPFAGTGTAMERDYDSDTKVYLSDLRAAEEIGRTAGERAVRRQNPRQLPSGRVTVVYDSRISGGLVGHLQARLASGRDAEESLGEAHDLRRLHGARRRSEPHQRQVPRSRAGRRRRSPTRWATPSS